MRGRFRRLVFILGLSAVALSVAAAVHVYLTLRPALSGARSVHGTVRNVQALASPESRLATRVALEAAIVELDDGRARISKSPVFRLARFLPGLGTQRDGVIELVDDERRGARSAIALLSALDSAADATRQGGGAIPPEAFAGLSRQARVTAAEVRQLVRPAGGLWRPVEGARRRLNRDAVSTANRLDHAAEAVETARTYMGAAGERRHLVAIQNNAEMRNQGMVLSYAVVRMVDGRPTFERTGSTIDLQLDRPVDTPVPAGMATVFGEVGPNQLWQSVNATADFAWSGRAMADMYRQATGESIDGVIAIDVPGLASLLGVLGTVQVPGIPEPLSAENLARIVLHDLYQGLSTEDDAIARRNQLTDVTKAMIERVTGGAGDVVALAAELGKVAAAGHLRFWSPVPTEEEVFERIGFGGGPAVIDPDRTFHIAVQNRTATKLDYFVKPSVRQDIRLTPEGDVVVRTTVRLHNEAPAGAGSSYQFGPDRYTSRPGEYIGWVLLWAPAGSEQAGSVVESGLNLAQAIVTVGPGETVEGAFETRIRRAVRNSRLKLRLVPQPRLVPIDLDVRIVEAAGWKVRDATSWQGPWDRVRTFTWRLDR